MERRIDLKTKEFERLTAMCQRVEYVFQWNNGSLKGNSSKSEVTRLRNQLILDAYDRKTEVKHLAEYFGKTVQSIYDSIKKARDDREYYKKYSMVQQWLCDV